LRAGNCFRYAGPWRPALLLGSPFGLTLRRAEGKLRPAEEKLTEATEREALGYWLCCQG
jgi:hypothetical protein